jgi:hypothetical protein
MNTLFKRMIGASRLDALTYEQVEADRTGTAGAVFVVVLASACAAIGTGARDPLSIVAATVALMMTWMIWVTLTYIIGTRVMPDPGTHADIGEVVRTTGFSAAPGVLRLFGFLPLVGLPILIATTIWMLFTFVVAIRQALDYANSARALAVCVLGWLIHGLLFFGFALVAV